MTHHFRKNPVEGQEWFEDFLYNSETYRDFANCRTPPIFKQTHPQIRMAMALTFTHVAVMIQDNTKLASLFMTICGMKRLFEDYGYGPPTQLQLEHYYNFRFALLRQVSRRPSTREPSFEDKVFLALFTWNMADLQKLLENQPC